MEVFTRLLRSFHRWVFDPVHVWEQLRAVWRKVYHHVVVDGQAMFQRVVGPMGAVIASIASLGWDPSTLEGWYDHDGIFRQFKKVVLNLSLFLSFRVQRLNSGSMRLVTIYVVA